LLFNKHFNSKCLKIFSYYFTLSDTADNEFAGNATHKDGNSSDPAQTPDKSSGLITVVVIVGPIVALLVVAGVSTGNNSGSVNWINKQPNCFYCILQVCYVFFKRIPKPGNSMNFVNPTYNKTTEDTFSLEKNASINGSSRYAPALDEEVSGSMVTSAVNPNDFSYVRF